MWIPQLYEVRTSCQLTLIPMSVTTEARSLLINVWLLVYSSIKKQARLCEMTMLYVYTASLPFFHFGSNRLIFFTKFGMKSCTSELPEWIITLEAHSLNFFIYWWSSMWLNMVTVFCLWMFSVTRISSFLRLRVAASPTVSSCIWVYRNLSHHTLGLCTHFCVWDFSVWLWTWPHQSCYCKYLIIYI